MKKLMSLVTTGGNVYRAQVVGFFDGMARPTGWKSSLTRPRTRPVVRRRWNRRDLGTGYTPEVLGVPASDDAK